MEALAGGGRERDVELVGVGEAGAVGRREALGGAMVLGHCYVRCS